MDHREYDIAYAARQLGRSRNIFRRLVKGFYLRNLLKDVRGAAIDFGCGAGQLLEKLPAGSIGLEVNPELVRILKSQGKNVLQYAPDADQLRFNNLPGGPYKTFIMSHVLEHFENAADGLTTILRSCRSIGVERVIIVVPGKKGYDFDNTHRSFVTRDYLLAKNMQQHEGYKISHMNFFPLDIEAVGTFFTFHELKIIYDKID